MSGTLRCVVRAGLPAPPRPIVPLIVFRSNGTSDQVGKGASKCLAGSGHCEPVVTVSHRVTGFTADSRLNTDDLAETLRTDQCLRGGE